MFYPLTFQPIFQERIWGGRKIADLYGKALPPGKLIGESWEIVDRPEAQSVVASGPLKGLTLEMLMKKHRAEMLGPAQPSGSGRFPVLVKILDARETLSLQVHPPRKVADRIGGEPKTELWYIAHAEGDACIYTGLKKGTTRQDFEKKMVEGSIAGFCHRQRVRAGDAMFLPSGRLHAIGAGTVIFEIQQNSDTTFRVFDWNRPGLDGKARQLHLPESLASIDFDDCEPALLKAAPDPADMFTKRPLVQHSLFDIDLMRGPAGSHSLLPAGSLQILGVTTGTLSLVHPSGTTVLNPGQFSLIPAVLSQLEVIFESQAAFLHVRPR